MNIDQLLPAAQLTQLAKLTAELMSHGFGRLEVIVEQGQVRWLRPAELVYNPECITQSEIEPELTFQEMLGAWAPAFQSGLAKVMAGKWGSLYLGVEHGRIRYIETTPSIRARTGKTGPLAVAGRAS